MDGWTDRQTELKGCKEMKPSEELVLAQGKRNLLGGWLVLHAGSGDRKTTFVENWEMGE